MLQNEVIEESSNSYTFNIIVIRKKDSIKKGIDILYINYVFLNKLIILNKYSLSNINKILFLRIKMVYDNWSHLSILTDLAKKEE